MCWYFDTTHVNVQYDKKNDNNYMFLLYVFDVYYVLLFSYIYIQMTLTCL